MCYSELKFSDEERRGWFEITFAEGLFTISYDRALGTGEDFVTTDYLHEYHAKQII